MIRSTNAGQRCRLITVIAVVFAAISFSGVIIAQGNSPIEGPLLITYGKEANVSEGDPTFHQVIYISLPDQLKERVYIRLFDPDTGGDYDAISRSANTDTRFAIFGGEDAFAGDVASDAELTGGTLLQERSYTDSQDHDGRWINFALLSPSQGDLIGEQRIFRLVVETQSGDDGNVYDVITSLREHRNLQPDGVRLFSYAPTVRVPNRSTLTELRFTAPIDQNVISVNNFDAAGADLNLTTRFRSLELSPSGQGVWSKTNILLRSEEQGKTGAITLQGGNEMPNDATFFITDEENRRLALDLPVFNWRPNNRPSIQLTTRDLDSCRKVAFDASQSTDADNDRLTVSWYFDDGTALQGPNVVKEYVEPGKYLERVELMDDSGQVGAGSYILIPVNVKYPPMAQAYSPASVAVGETVNFDASPSSSDGWNIAEYEWVFNDGPIITGQQIQRQFDSPGDYLAILKVRDDSGHACDSASIEIPVRVNAPPVAEAGPDHRTEIGTSLSFDAGDSYDPDGSLTAYGWDMGDGTTLSGQLVNHTYKTAGTYRVELSVTDDATASNSVVTDASTVFVNAPPEAIAGPDRTVAVGEVVEFNGQDSNDADGRIIHYEWDFGDGARGTGQAVEYAYAQPGSYSVHLIVTDDSKTSSQTSFDTLKLHVNAPPTANAGDDIQTSGGEVTFNGQLSSDSDDEIAQYVWEFGDGASGTGPTPTHVYQQAGEYEVRLTVTDASGTVNNSASDTLRVIINSPPLADAGPDIIGSPGEELTFQASRSVDPDGDIVEYEWDFKDGSTGNGEITTHTYNKAGLYHVRLKVIDNSGNNEAISFDETRVFINAQPVAEAGDDILVAPGQPAILSASRSYDNDGQVTDFRWDFSDKQDPVYGENQTITYDTPGIYNVTLTVSDDSGAVNSIAQDQVTIRVNHQPIADAGPDIFSGRNFMTFDGTASSDADGDALSYQWNFGDGTIVNAAVVAHTFADGGSYPVVLTVNDGTGLQNGTNRDSMIVKINNPPVANAGSNQRICTGDILVLDGSESVDPDGGVLKYAWDFGDGKTSTIVNPTTTYTRGGVYPLTLTVTDDSGLANATHTNRVAVTVDQAPTADAGSDMKVCANTVVSFDGSGSVDADGVVNQFIWDFGDGGSGGGDKPKYIYEKAGIYPVRLTIHGDQVGQCDYRASDEIAVEVTAAPVPVITAPDIVPVGTEVSFDGSTSFVEDGNISSWAWDFADGTTTEGPQHTHTFHDPGVYRVALSIESDTDSADCSTITAYHVITVNAAPVADAGLDIAIGINEEVVLNGSQSSDPDGGITRYDWDLGDGTTGEGVVYRHRYSRPGEYNVKLTVTDTTNLANSSTSDTLLVTVHSGATAVFDAPDVACVGESINLSAAQSVSSEAPVDQFKWTLGDGTESTDKELTKSYQSPGRYTISLLVDDAMGRSSSTHTAVKVLQINDPPSAYGGPDQLVCPGAPVVFDASASKDSDGRISSVLWDFGDGHRAEGVQATHVFNEPGKYQINVSVTDDSQSSCATQTDTVTVTVNTPPQANAGPDRNVLFGGANDAVWFNGLESFDPDGSDLAYVWSFGDDTQRTGGRVSHSFDNPGDYEVLLSVSDGSRLACGSASDTLQVTVSARE